MGAVKGKQFFNMTKEELAQCGRVGGVKSGETKRRKKEMREIVDILFSTPMKSGKLTTAEQIKNFADIKGKNIDIGTAIIIAQINKALKGDTQSATFLRDTAGQKPKENVNVDLDLPVILSGEDEIED